MAAADPRMMVRSDFRAVAGVTATDVRVSPRWRPTTKKFATAFDDNGNPVFVNGARTVKVIRDGITTYVPAASFGRKSRTTRNRVVRVNRTPETARIPLKGMDWSQ